MNRCKWVNLNNEKYIEYHDNEWGVPVYDDQKLFEMLLLESFQAGLSWECILNKRDYFKFMLGDVSKLISKVDLSFDTLIIDPPRKGLDKKTREFILKKIPKKIIYVSCDPNTLIRDLKELESNYEISDFKIMDMFSNTYHVESFVVLIKK